MFGVLAGGDVNAVFPENGCGVDLAWALGSGIFVGGVVLFVFGRVAVEFPGDFQEIAVAFLDRFGVEGVAPAVAAAEENELAAIDLAGRRGTPLAMIDARPDMRLVFSAQLTGLFVDRNETGRQRRRDVRVGPVLAV